MWIPHYWYDFISGCKSLSEVSLICLMIIMKGTEIGTTEDKGPLSEILVLLVMVTCQDPEAWAQPLALLSYCSRVSWLYATLGPVKGKKGHSALFCNNDPGISPPLGLAGLLLRKFLVVPTEDPSPVLQPPWQTEMGEASPSRTETWNPYGKAPPPPKDWDWNL